MPDHPDRMLISGGCGSGETNSLLNLIKETGGNFIDKIHWYAKDFNKSKYQFYIKKREDVGVKHLNDSKAFIEHSNITDDIYNNFDDYKPNRNRKILIVFGDMIADYYD